MLKVINILKIDDSVSCVCCHYGVLEFMTGVFLFVSHLFLRQHDMAFVSLQPLLTLTVNKRYSYALNSHLTAYYKAACNNLLPSITKQHTHTHTHIITEISSGYLNSGRMQEQGQGLGKGRGRRGEMGR